MTAGRRSLILAGGGMKVAFQAGVLQVWLDRPGSRSITSTAPVAARSTLVDEGKPENKQHVYARHVLPWGPL